MPPDDPPRPRRERSNRYPGVPLAEALELCRTMDARGLDGLGAEALAQALGYTSIKTNTFSARLSAARQFGLLASRDDGHALTPLARSILHPVDPAEVPRLHRQALREPPLYADLIARMADRRVPEPAVLANVLYHNHHITAAAKQPAADAFLASARFAGALGEDGILRPDGPPTAAQTAPAGGPERPAAPRAPKKPGVRIDLNLWGADAGKVLRVRAPESITPASFERFLQAFRLLVRVEEPAEADEPPG